MRIEINLPESVTFKACGATHSVMVAELCAAAHQTLWTYGLGRFAQDYTNSQAFAYKKATGLEMTDADKRALVTSCMKHLAKTGLRPGAESSDPVEVEAMRLAEAAILKSMGADTRKGAEKHAKFGVYFSTSEKGYTSPNAAAFRKVLDAHPTLMTKAREIVAARSMDIAIDL